MVVPDDGFARLVAAARDGDESAIATIYRRHQPRLLRVLRAEVGDAADDVASQTWLEAVGALGRFDGDEGGFRAFLFTIARRRLADHRRSQRRRPAVPIAPVDLHGIVDANREVDLDALAMLDAEGTVRTVASHLSRADAEIVLLRIVGGLSVEQVAGIVGRKPGAVRVQQHRALRKLAIAFQERTDRADL